VKSDSEYVLGVVDETNKSVLVEKGTKLGSEVLIIGEEYTSKTCSNCGTLENKLGNKDILKCKSCGLCIDRDTNGARNILIKHLK